MKNYFHTPTEKKNISPCNVLETRLLGRFTPIFYFIWEHFLFVHIEKKNNSYNKNI